MTQAHKINYSGRKPDGSYRELTTQEWKLVRRMSQDGKTVAEVVEALGNAFSPGIVYDRGKARGMTFSRKSAHLGNTKLSLGGKHDTEKFEREHPAHPDAEQAHR